MMTRHDLEATPGWSGETPDLFFATRAFPPAGLRHHMVVETLPGGGWDWAAWANDGSGRSLHGTAESRPAAMQAAERALAMMRCYSVARPGCHSVARPPRAVTLH